MYNTTSQLPLPETTTFVIVFRPPSNRIPSAAQSDSVRRPIRFRPPSDQIPSAARSDSVRRPTPIPNIFITHSQYIHHNLQTLTKHILAIYTLIFGV